jgi:AcrR family transcriptional regulator
MYELVSLVNLSAEEGRRNDDMAPKVAGQQVQDKAPARTQDPEGTRQNIIEIASEEFALNGLAGARIDEIAARTRSSKRMIYYYFGDKEGLYLSALENAYRLVREGEAKLDVAGLSPLEALRKLVEFTFDHHHKHEDFIRMVMIENIHHAEYLVKSKVIRQLNVTAIGTIEQLFRRGVDEGLFRPGLDPIELHWQISALCFFNVSNRATFSKLFGRDLSTAASQASLKRNAVDMVLRYVVRPEKLPAE